MCLGRYLHICSYTCQQMKEDTMNLKENKNEYIGFEVEKGKGKWCNYNLKKQKKLLET